jgi:NAD(P)-dependent dehydrogenase (short-subunit alcohol dehydrogenase family)
MPARLLNKIAIITGSSSGIGRATALAYTREGATVVLSDLQESPLQIRPETSDLTTQQELEKQFNIKPLFIKCDTTISADVENLIAKTVEQYGRLDIIVNNAGIGEPKPGPIWEMEEEHFDLAVRVNLKGVFLGTKFAARQMVGQEPGESGDRGWIVNLASVLGLRAQGYTGMLAF